MITSMVLSDPARGLSCVLIPNDAIRVASFDVTPAVREVSEDWAKADGASDTTAYLSAAAVTIDLAAVGSAGSTIAEALDAIGGLLLPWARPYLIVADDEWPGPRQIQLRFDSLSHPYELSTVRQVQLAFKAPRGCWEDSARQVFEVAADLPDATGLAFTEAGAAVTAAAGFAFSPSSSAGSAIIAVSGNARPRWTARLYGPATGPKLTRDDTGQSFEFTNGLTLGAGEYVEIDSLAKTVLLMSDAAASRLSFVDFSRSEWFPLDPGYNRLRYHASAGTSAGSIAVVTVLPVWMP